MELTRYNLEPTEENILRTLKKNTSGRNSSLPDFLEVLNQPSISSLALNGEWGSGKTFFIQQAILLLNTLADRSPLEPSVQAEVTRLLKNRLSFLKMPQLSGPVLPVYYNAWLYDDHSDPVHSLLYFLSVTFEKQYGIRDPDTINLFAGALKALESCFKADLSALASALRDQDARADIRSLEDAKQMLQEAFHDLLGESDTLVIFVDELDRCSPAYAVRFLERVKHFFDCPGVKFVFATNLQQLGATIQCFYGADFDSTKYLTKFFDYTLELPPIDRQWYLQCQSLLQESDVSQSLRRALISYFDFSFRDLNLFLTETDRMASQAGHRARFPGILSNEQLFCQTFFPPILTALHLHDRSLRQKVLAGQGAQLIWDIFRAWPDGEGYYATLMLPRTPNGATQAPSGEELKIHLLNLYHSIFCVNFSSPAKESLHQSILQLSSGF